MAVKLKCERCHNEWTVKFIPEGYRCPRCFELVKKGK